MPGGLGPRFAIEAGFLVLVAVGAALADLSARMIILCVAIAWVLVALIEWTAWRESTRFYKRYYAPARGWPQERPGVTQEYWPERTGETGLGELADPAPAETAVVAGADEDLTWALRAGDERAAEAESEPHAASSPEDKPPEQKGLTDAEGAPADEHAEAPPEEPAERWRSLFRRRRRIEAEPAADAGPPAPSHVRVLDGGRDDAASEPGDHGEEERAAR